MMMKGIAKGLRIHGIGQLEWKFLDYQGSIQTIKTEGYYIPGLKTRLLSPQAYFLQQQGGDMLVNGTCCKFRWKNGATMTINYLPQNNLLIAMAFKGDNLASQKVSINTCVSDEVNQNLTPKQKLLLQWHFKLGHMSFVKLQALVRKGHLPEGIATCHTP